jgi:hypothetical protein
MYIIQFLGFCVCIQGRAPCTVTEGMSYIDRDVIGQSHTYLVEYSFDFTTILGVPKVDFLMTWFGNVRHAKWLSRNVQELSLALLYRSLVDCL